MGDRGVQRSMMDGQTDTGQLIGGGHCPTYPEDEPSSE